MFMVGRDCLAETRRARSPTARARWRRSKRRPRATGFGGVRVWKGSAAAAQACNGGGIVRRRHGCSAAAWAREARDDSG